MDGSVVFSSFHASKGRERKYVYVLGFEANYFRYFARDSKPHICPNTLYVAATRAKECICIAGHKAQKHRLQFLAPERESVWNDYVSIVFAREGVGFSGDDDDDLPEAESNVLPVTSLLDQLDEYVLHDALSFVEFAEIRPAFQIDSKTVDPASRLLKMATHAPSRVKLGPEKVSDINGLVITSFLEVYKLRRSEPSILRHVREAVQVYKNIDSWRRLAKDFDAHIQPTVWSDATPPATFLRLTAMHKALCGLTTRGLPTYYTQLADFSWLEREDVDICLERISHAAATDLSKVEVEVKHSCTVEAPGRASVVLQGIFDVETHDRVIELKATEDLTSTHKLQLVCYAFICATEEAELEMGGNGGLGKSIIIGDSGSSGSGGGECGNGGGGGGGGGGSSSSSSKREVSFSLLNVLSGEHLLLKTKDPAQLRAAVSVLIEGKFGDKSLVDDDAFLSTCKKLHERNEPILMADLNYRVKRSDADGKRQRKEMGAFGEPENGEDNGKASPLPKRK